MTSDYYPTKNLNILCTRKCTHYACTCTYLGPLLKLGCSVEARCRHTLKKLGTNLNKHTKHNNTFYVHVYPNLYCYKLALYIVLILNASLLLIIESSQLFRLPAELQYLDTHNKHTKIRKDWEASMPWLSPYTTECSAISLANGDS